MNKVFLLSIYTVSLLVLLGCDKGFLEEKPYSFLSGEALYNSNEGAEAAINGCYTAMADYGGFGAGYLTLTTITSGGFNTKQSSATDMNNLTFGASTIWLTNNSPWDAFYRSIKVANDIIAYLPNGGADEKTKAKIIGEAHFLRGMLYFNLVRLFGGVPLHTIPVGSEHVDLPRSTEEQVYELIIADLEKAKGMMVNPGEHVSGRPHKYAAYALLGKVYLTLAGNDSDSPYWTKAKNELLEVYGKYSLTNSFAKLFAANNENTDESILEIQYTISGGPNGQFTNFFTPGGSVLTPQAQNGPFGRNRPNKELLDSHLARYPQDPRLAVTYIYNEVKMNDGSVKKIYPKNTKGEGFPYIGKYADPDYVATYSNRNFIYLRYADVLLMLAECENEINGPSTDALKYVNEVLIRAKKINEEGTQVAKDPVLWTVNNMGTKDSFRKRILEERRYELLGECHLWFDLRRRGWEYLKSFLEAHNNNPNFSVGFDVKYPLNERLMLLPIPQVEINANTEIGPEDQNPGY